MKRGNLSTQIQKGPLIFVSVGVAVCTALVVIFAVFGKWTPLAIGAIIFSGILDVAGIALLAGILLDYAYIDDKTLYMHYIFKSSKIDFADIDRIELKDDIYTVYAKNNRKIGTMFAHAPGCDKIIAFLDRSGVKVV